MTFHCLILCLPSKIGRGDGADILDVALQWDPVGMCLYGYCIAYTTPEVVTYGGFVEVCSVVQEHCVSTAIPQIILYHNGIKEFFSYF